MFMKWIDEKDHKVVMKRKNVLSNCEVLSLHDVPTDSDINPQSPMLINDFELIGMSYCLDLSGPFKKEV
ncbi:CBL-interacting serine/threonine-protein kinase 1-like protein [Tanacetum coccineum]